MTPRQRWDAWWLARHPRADTHAMGQRNIYILPSRPGLFFCATLAVLLLASINDQLSLGYGLTFLLAGAGFASMHSTHGNLRGLSLDLRAPAPGFAGDELLLEVRLHNPGAARYGVGIALQQPGAAEPAWCDVPAQGHSLLQLRCPMPRRGLQTLPTLRIETRFPLGLFRAWSLWRPAAEVWIYPQPEAGAPPLPMAGTAADGDAPAPGLRLPGVDFEGVRPYRVGDSLRQVLWKKAAQTDSSALMVRDSAAAAGRKLWLDRRDTAAADTELALSRLAAWVLQADRLGLPYGLRLGAQSLDPDQGPAQRQAALQLLAAAPPSDA